MYEYRCRVCEHQETLLESTNAARIKKCPACGKRSFSRLISAAAFHLKGSGWYATDFRDKKKDENLKEENPKDDKSGGKSEKTKKSDKADDKTKSTPKDTAEKKPAATDKSKNKADK